MVEGGATKIAFMIWTIVSGIFLMIGLSCWKSKKEVGFFTGVKPPKMKDVVAYNHAVAKIWFVFAAVLETTGIPLLFIQQNSPFALLLVGEMMILVIAVMIVYIRVEKKYRA